MSIISIKNGDAFTSSQDEVGVIAGDYATQSYVNTAISDLIDSSPSTLDTLNELAAALGDDANFASTITTSIAAKLPLAGGTMTGDLTLSGAPTSTLHATTKAYVDSVSGATTLDALTDVTTGMVPGIRNVLWYEGASIGGDPPKWLSQELNLNDSMFANMAISSLSDNEFLKYDSSVSKWKNSNTLTSPKMHEIIGDGSVSGGGDRLIFKTLYTGGWSYGLTGPAVNWNTDHQTLAWQDPGYDRILTWQLATDQNKNIFRIDAHNLDSVTGNGVKEPRSVNAGSFVSTKKYKITSAGDTDFTAIGAASNAVHTVFTATDVGSGTGTADQWDTGAQSVAFNLKGADNIGFVNAGSFVTSRNYTIKATDDGDGGGTTDFTAIGAADNNVGTTFTATGAGSGTGVAIDLRPNEGSWNQFGSHTGSQTAPGWPTNLQFGANKISFHGEYVFPTEDGSADQVLTTDGSGQLSFAAPETITLATLKTEVAASTDFADFQSRIAAL